ncbi:MAG: family 16 glycosylhydrolase [Bacteroidales bacterium]|nr:family 16 glycosylhydrolase [Bacteroidales bacterium]
MKLPKLFKTNQTNTPVKSLGLSIPFIFLIFLSATIGCEKNDPEAGFKADFNFSFIDDSHIQFTNASEGEYYSLIWNFGNGVSDTTTDKKQTYNVYYPEAGDYDVSLKLTNYTGDNVSTTKTVSISISSLIVSFTADIDATNPNMVLLKNTTQGLFDTFKWRYRNEEVENETEHLAYFPFSGNYDIELIVTNNNQDYSLIQSVVIAQDDPNYNPNLVWSEEFDYTGLPGSSNWNMETGGGGWGNNELQYYTNSQNNAMVENGVLTITAREEEYGGRDYTSARITTQNKFDFKYGKIEARIKLPYGQGLWPAFWMLGANISSVGWPACGEIDIMEMIGGSGGNDKTCHTTLHWDNNGDHASYGESYTLSSGIFADDYHIFAVEWDSQEIRGYVDENKFYTANLTPAELSEFRNNFFIILNVAVGGNWPGSPDATTVFPQTMKVDYVRVYQE